MFCPQCGNESHGPNKFCKSCGANLHQVKKVMKLGPAVGTENQSGLDWYKEVFRRKSPEEKRLNEIKGGVITTCIGIGSSVFLYFLLTAVAGNETGSDAEILHVVRWVGVIPLLIGLGILFNSLVISKRLVEISKNKLDDFEKHQSVPAIDTSPMQRLAQPAEPVISDFSVTEPTTTKLREPVPVKSESSSDTN